MAELDDSAPEETRPPRHKGKVPQESLATRYEHSITFVTSSTKNQSHGTMTASTTGASIPLPRRTTPRACWRKAALPCSSPSTGNSTSARSGLQSRGRSRRLASAVN